MKPRFLLPLLLFLTLPPLAAVRAAPLAEPVARDITDTQGRILSVRIIEVSPESLTVLRVSDMTRFDISLANLSQADRDYAARLLADALAHPVLPDTSWLDLVRRDFRVFDPGSRLLVPLPASSTSKQQWILIGVGYAPTNAPTPRQFARFQSRFDTETTLLLWLSGNGTALGIELAGEELPAGVALLAHEPMLKASTLASAILEEARHARARRMSERSGSRPVESGPVSPENNPFRIPDDERPSLVAKLLRQLPAYWPRPPYHSDIDPGGSAQSGTLYPHVYLYRRNGHPVRHRGSPVQGKIQDVLRLINEQAGEFE